MDRIILHHADVITPYRVLKNHSVVVCRGKIEAVVPAGKAGEYQDAHFVDAGGCRVMPGFIDLHVHGGGGADFMEGTVDSIAALSAFHLRHGTTTLLPTTNCAPTEAIYAALDALREAKRGGLSPNLYGAHLEGPFVSKEQLGALNAEACRPPNADDIARLLEYTDVVARVTAAPEVEGTLAMARAFHKRGILMSVGHSNATYDDMLKALENGFTHLTHFYSAMSTVRRVNAYRIAGVVESGYLLDDLTVEIIADGCHLPPALLKLVYKCKGPSATALVTDAICAAGLPEGKARGSGGREILIEDGVAKLPDRSAFAGSLSTMEHLLKQTVELAGVPLIDAVAMATITPARILGIDKRKGAVAPGMDADLVVLDSAFSVRLVLAGGQIYHNGLGNEGQI